MRSSRFDAWLLVSLGAHLSVAAAGVLVATPLPAPEAGKTVLVGDTLDVPGLDALANESSIDLDQEHQAPTPPDKPSDGLEPARPRAPPRPRSKVVVRDAPETANPGDRGGDAEPARFGAVGERGSVDLATAFTRGFPQAASADPLWSKTGFGPTGVVDVVLVIDDTGHLSEARLEPGGSVALRQALARTIALIRGRTFTARHGTTRLRVSGTVSADAVRNDARSGDVFAIGGSYTGRSGSAFFSLSIGRRIDVTITDR